MAISPPAKALLGCIHAVVRKVMAKQILVPAEA